MSAAREDLKPCIYTGCSGTMQFAAEPVEGRDGATGWVCNTTPNHFHRPVSKRNPATSAATASANWDDDGGNGRGTR